VGRGLRLAGAHEEFQYHLRCKSLKKYILMYLCICICMYACVRACARLHVCVCLSKYICVCVDYRLDHLKAGTRVDLGH